MLKFKWTSVTIRKNKQAAEMVALFKKIQPEVGACDTETNGLHIILCKPFLYQFGFVDLNTMQGYTYVVDIEKQPELATQVIKAWHNLASTLKLYLGHNPIFDLHMTTNIGLPYRAENISDTQFYIRYAHDALHQKEGGPPLKLKAYAEKYIDRDARYHERLLDSEKTSIVKELNIKLKTRLSKCTYNGKPYTLKVLNEIFSDPIADYKDLPQDAQNAYFEWLNKDVPQDMRWRISTIAKADLVPYNILNRENVIKYAHLDIVYPLEIWYSLDPVIKARHNEVGIQIENNLIIPLLEMERVGFAANIPYLESCKENLKQYIIERRKVMQELLGEEIKIGQHQKIKELFAAKFNINLETTDKNEIDILKSDLIHNKQNADAVKFISILQELRTLEKWYSTYIIRFLNELKQTDRLYTTIHQVGTVSGRVSSDFQQFPSKAIYKQDGSNEELFHPRRIITVSGEHKKALVMADFSQIELRIQAFYTILVGSADLNLCRAYMPYKCVNREGREFNYNDPMDIKNWEGEWFLNEDHNVKWTPTDIHGATTTTATGLKPGDPGFSDARKHIGKRTNFAKNYGAQLGKIKQMFPDKTDEEQQRINNAYYETFPGVKGYQDYCYKKAMRDCCTTNLLGVKYYNVSGHKLINMLIQGSAAHFLKIKEREVYDYCKEHKLYSQWCMQIHDELMWLYDDRDDPACIWEFKRIMEDWPDSLIPMVAEVDATKSTWDAKEGVKDLNALRLYLSA